MGNGVGGPLSGKRKDRFHHVRERARRKSPAILFLVDGWRVAARFRERLCRLAKSAKGKAIEPQTIADC